MPYAIEVEHIKKTFKGKRQVRALDGVSFSVEGAHLTLALEGLLDVLDFDGVRHRRAFPSCRWWFGVWADGQWLPVGGSPGTAPGDRGAASPHPIARSARLTRQAPASRNGRPER